MSTTSIGTSPKSKRPARGKPPCDEAQASPRAKPKPAPITAPTVSKTTTPPIEGRATKQEHVLTLLSRPEGASIEEMMQTTEWQQHSVRGFLAGTVKKKLGFTLTSSKAEGDVRRYRIE